MTRRLIIFILAVILATPLPAQAQAAERDWVTHQWDAMGTRATLTFWPPQKTRADVLIQSVEEEFERINQRFSPWIENSELSQVNRLAYQQAVTVSEEFAAVLERGQHYYQITEQAFDVTFAGVGDLYDYRQGKAPDSKALEQNRGGIGMHNVQFKDSQVRFLHPDTRIDFGGIAKGHAIDQAITLLRAAGVEHAWLGLGGDSRLLGDRRGRLWQVGIRHPRNPDETALMLPAADIAISTSGDYERYFIDGDGQRLHHILDPASGRPARGLVSVTVMTSRGMDADALSTGLFVMGPKEGMALANRLEGVSAIMIDEGGQVSYSRDLMPPD